MLAKKEILVVEDNEINRMMLCELLSSEYDVLDAENGQEALAVLEKHKDDVALILLDIIMPVMDGYTFLSIAKADPSLSSIPVIVTTQSDSEADEVSALSHGAADFVAKPYKPQIILHRVASIIHLRETAAMINQFQYDRLTGLYSKEYFYQKAKETLQQNPERRYDIICSDIENFKLINDVFGIPAGDRLLCGIAELYRQVVNARGAYGRLNADQFVCLIEPEGSYTDEMFIQINEKVSQLPNAKNVVMKWGIYSVEDRNVSVEQMCDRALLAARSIKGQYGKYFAAYDDKLRDELLRQQAIIDEMESALKEEQFLIYLQPKYRIRDDKLAGAEALVRWNHPKWGVQSPAEFIPLFEKNGFITKLDQFVWDKTCSYLREWDKKGYPPIPVSVNVSRADIYNADIADILMNTVKKYGLPPSRLHLEITESAYTENPGQIIETVSHLRELGFIIEMDDFGSGYSSLNMLNQMPIDILKLDMKFIQSETVKPANQGVFRFIMELARWMHLSVVAEGVETREQLERLLETGCDYVQGYFFARPMPEKDFEDLIREQLTDDEQEQQRKESDGDIGSGYQKKLLLIADEDKDYRNQFREAFLEYFQVAEAADMDAALEAAEAYKGRITAVLLSLTLPEAGGLAVLTALKRNKAVWDIPVIVTGGPDLQMEKKALELGAADYAVKPHAKESLWKRVVHATRLASLQNGEKNLQEEAYRDHMTGVLNRRGWEAALGSLRKEEAPFAFYLFDLDDLKQINDTFGHMEGDRLIQEFSQILRSKVRETDILARYGGDEFVAVIKSMPSGEIALKKGKEICRSLSDFHFADGLPVTVSVGVAIWEAQSALEDVMRKVDLALYRAKANGKGGCCLWEERD
ncbi:EAL domain-containing protein [Lacrimispora sp. NSJ-141]|uniref:Stage 0 sporulation protein A homolog n=1 Tax=Lientehia hominis TaxID=2897778 RepID=A0AAP2WAI1_9FIRM|nr:EAL domain-containing protein [Lientehia hominis]MCD2493392.1 EAL domain-containing protein [Lientehia hominis]